MCINFAPALQGSGGWKAGSGVVAWGGRKMVLNTELGRRDTIPVEGPSSRRNGLSNGETRSQ